MILFFLSPPTVNFRIAGLEEAKNLAGEILRLIQDRLGDAQCGKNLVRLSKQSAASVNRRFEFQKSRQQFLRTHNETPSVVAMRVNNSHRLPVGINR